MKQAWRLVLKTLYEKDLERSYYRLRDSEIDRTHPLFEDINSLSLAEFQGAVRFLDRNDLIEDKGEGIYQLSRKGFDVARDSEFKSLQSLTNTRIAWFTFIIAAVEIASVYPILSAEEKTANTIALGFFAIGLLVIALVTLFKPDIMQKFGT